MGGVADTSPGGDARPHATPTPKRLRGDDLPCLHPNAAGLDLGASAIAVAVPPDRDAEPVRVCETFTPELHARVDGRVACPLDPVALASTGISWVPIVALLEQHGLTPALVTARQVKTVPGRQTDGNEAQWLQKLPTRG